MAFTPDHVAELNLLALFHSTSAQEGIKVHQHSAPDESVRAAERLHQKGLITQKDGGYLTTLGSEAVELIQKLQSIVSEG
ncbi:TIGR02647 family protein [Marinobacter sp.]|uniref:TIGR02647 family protein n=1 Tax=Marinobacter sp. TaxID=50741 RepID=UPI0034A11143